MRNGPPCDMCRVYRWLACTFVVTLCLMLWAWPHV